MKPRTYFRLALLFPYILWGICALIFFLLSRLEISETWNIVLMPIAFYAFGVILWFFPYTILAAGMWFWGRNKSRPALWKSAMLAPILFFALMLIELVLVSLPAESMTGFMAEVPRQSAVLGFFSLVFGYFCVGVAAGVYKFLRWKNLIPEEEVPTQEP